MASVQVRCDFCYAPHIEWKCKMETVPVAYAAWQLQMCDSCRLLLRNVIGPVLHRITHTELVTAIVQLMNSKGLTYEDLMKPLMEIRKAQEDGERNVQAALERSQGTGEPG